MNSSAVIGWNILSSMNAVHNFNQLQLQQDQHINKRHCLIKLALKCKKVQCDELILENPNSVFSWNIYRGFPTPEFMYLTFFHIKSGDSHWKFIGMGGALQ